MTMRRDRGAIAFALVLAVAAGTLPYRSDQQSVIPIARAQAQNESTQQAAVQALFTAGRYEEARKAGEEGLARAEKSEGLEGVNVAWWLNQLGLIYGAIGDYPKAEAALKRALSIREKVLGQEHPDTVVAMNNLAT